MESLTAFMPLDRRRALAAGQALPDRTRGAALFADISGFTPLTAALARELGPHRGAEELTRHLNRIYTPLIARVHDYHGSVIAFSGDAITCWFDHSAADGRPARPALACALAMQQVMQQLEAITTPGGAVTHLGLKVAVAAGPCRRFLVGDSDAQQIEVLAGATLDHMAAAEKMANQGDVIVTADLLNQLDSPPTVAAWRQDNAGRRYALISEMADAADAQPPPPLGASAPLAKTQARPWLLPPVYDRLQQGPDEFLAELRPAAAVFIKFSGIDYDRDDDAGAKLDAFVRRAQAILRRYEGFLLQITMGDKGSYLYMSFGAPLAHEDDAARAAAAALALQQLPAELPFLRPLQIGVSQGLTHSGAYGSPQRRTYGVMGAHVNISARLMTTAQPGQILISRPIVDRLDDGFALQALPPVKLKGIDDPFAIWDLRGRNTAVSPSPPQKTRAPLVGREVERQQLTTALAQLTNGRSSTLLIEGAAGIGKSHLVQTLLQEADTHAVQILLGQGGAIDKSTPYHAWRPIFEQLFDLTGSDTADLQNQILAQLPQENHQLAPLLTAVLPMDWPDTELTAQIEGEARQENTHNLLVNVLQTSSARQPLLLVLDDAHWLDSLSWSLVRRVQREVQPLLLVLVTRPFAGDAPSAYTDLQELASAQTLMLDMLPPAAVEQLVCQRLGVERLPPAMADLIHDKAEGNPFFSEELAYALRDAQLIVVEDGVCRLTADLADLDALNFPNTIQGVITSRIDLLPPTQQLTVKVASVIGRIFAFRVLNDIYPTATNAADLQQNLVHLERLDITPQETPEPNLAYIFKHIVIQEVVYSLMTFAQRKQLHRSTAVWYETAHAGEQTRLYPLLAHHWRQADDIPKAIDYYSKAGADAFRKYANQEAIRFLNQAVNLSEELDDASPPIMERAHWQRLLGEATYRLTLMEESRAHYKAALALLDHPLPDGSARRALGLSRQLLKQVWHRWQPRRFVGRAASDAEREALLEASRLYDGVAEIYYNAGDFLTSSYCVMTAFNLAEEAGTSPELARGYANMCATLGAVSLNGMADNYRERALQMAGQIDDLATRAYIQIPLSSHSLWVGNWVRAEAEIGETLAIYERLGDWRRWCVAAWLWPQVVQSQGRLQAARDLWAELLAVARRSHDTRHQVRCLGGQTFNFLTLGDEEAVFACVEAAGVILEENPEMMPVEERLWYALTATQALYRGEWSEARSLAHSLLEAIDRARFKFDLLDVFSAAAEVFLALWEQGEATEKEAQAGCKPLTQYARTYAFARPRLLRCQARLAWLEGKQRRAQKLWRQSADRAEALGMTYEQGATWQQLGHYLDDAGYLAQAQAVAAEIGAVYGNGRFRPSSSTPAARD